MPRKAAPPDLSTQAGRLMSARMAAGFEDRKAAAAALAMPHSTYESHENSMRAKKGIPIDLATQYARRFRVDLGWLLTGRGPRQTHDNIQVVGFIGAGAEVFVSDGDARMEEIGIAIDDPERLEWYEVRGDSMKPRVYPGEYVAFYRVRKEPRDFLRQECLVVLDDGRSFFKKLNPGSAPGLYDLISYNDEERPDERVVEAGGLAMIVSRITK